MSNNNSTESKDAKSASLVEVGKDQNPSKGKSAPPSFFFLAFLLFLTCLNLLANNFLNNAIRANAPFWVPHINMTLTSIPTFSGIAKNLNLVSIFTGVFTGIVTDLLSAPVALVLMAIIGASGCGLFMLNTKFGATVVFYEIAVFIYGGALNNARIPMQKMASVLFEGPYLATAMNVNHTFSHISSILSTFVTPRVTNMIGIVPTIAFLAFIGWFSLPICMILYGLYTQKISVKGAGSADPLTKMLGDYLTQTEIIAWIVLAMGFFLDGTTVAFKNSEGAIYKLLGYDRDTANNISTVAKIALLFTPAYSYLVDRFTFRQYYFVIGSGIQTSLYGILWLLTSKKDAKISSIIMILIQLTYKIVTTIFLAAFYSYFAVTIPKKIRGVAFGANMSVLSISYYTNTIIIGAIEESKNRMLFLMLECLVGFGISLLIFFMNIGYKDTLNKDRIARNEKAGGK